jgi:hypothetical protein
MIQVHLLVCENSWIIEMHGATIKLVYFYFTFSIISIFTYNRSKSNLGHFSIFRHWVVVKKILFCFVYVPNPILLWISNLSNMCCKPNPFHLPWHRSPPVVPSLYVANALSIPWYPTSSLAWRFQVMPWWLRIFVFKTLFRVFCDVSANPATSIIR